MKTKIQTMGMKPTAILSITALALAIAPATVHAATKVVHPGAFTAIQKAIDDAAPGDKVIVLPGTYDCKTITEWWPTAVVIPVDKPGLTLKAVGPVKLVGAGNQDSPGFHNYGTAIRIEADGVTVEGFTISGFRKGITLTGRATWTETSPDHWEPLDIVRIQGARVSRNAIYDCIERSVEVTMASKCELVGNTVDGAGTGISIEGSSELRIAGNQARHADGDGIFLYQSPGCTVERNEADSNGRFGIYAQSSEGCTVANNTMNNNDDSGFSLGVSPNSVVTGNQCNNNADLGISYWESGGTTFAYNIAQGNEGLDLLTSGDTTECTFLMNSAGTASPSPEAWDVR